MTRSIVGHLAALTLSSTPLAAQGPAPTPLPPHGWNIDAAHSAVTFRVRHLGISWVNGAFRQWTGQLTYDPANPEAASVSVQIQTASVDTENERRDNDIKNNYLAVDSFPQLMFRSTRVERAGANRLRITGDLTIRDVTRSVVLDTEVGSVLVTARGTRTAFTATTSIRRQDFDVTRNPLMEGAQVVGDEVRITIDVEAIQPTAPPSPES